MKLKLTKLAKQDLKKLNKIQDEVLESDIDVYFDFSSYDQLLFDMQMFVEGAYVENKFKSIEQFASDISESEGSDVENVLERLNKAIKFELVTIS